MGATDYMDKDGALWPKCGGDVPSELRATDPSQRPKIRITIEAFSQGPASKYGNKLVTKSVKRVLDYYEAKGLAELRPYPLMPYTDKIDPNNSTYHMGEHLVERHCAFWSKTKYSSNNDIDDFFFHRNRSISLYDWMESIVQNKTKIGSFAIKHYGLQWNPPLLPRPFVYEDFLKLKGLQNPMVFKNERANKALFLTEYARQPFTHWVDKFFKGKRFYGAKSHEIVYLHARNSFEGMEINHKQTEQTMKMSSEVNLLGPDPEATLERIRNVTAEIFGSNPPPYTHHTTQVLGKCLHNWLKDQAGCRKPVTGCFNVAKYLDDWVFAEPTPEHRWTTI
ncbi:unnamed protein product, partial [Mesorhabditis spiculigera]